MRQRLARWRGGPPAAGSWLPALKSPVLVLNVGNSRCALGAFSAQGLDVSYLVSESDLAEALQRAIASDPQTQVVSLGVRAGSDAWLETLRRTHRTLRWLQLGAAQLGDSAYQSPTSLGADRIANCLAARAYAQRKRPVIVVDAGTATTFECLDTQGRFVGGPIVPGVFSAFRGLREAAPALPELSPQAPEAPLLAQDSQSAVDAGSFAAHRQLILATARELERSLGGRALRVLTGGLASSLDLPGWYVDADFTLKGAALATASPR